MGFVVLLLLIAFAAVFFWLHREGRARERAADLERRVFARKLGWNYDGTRDPGSDYRFAGEHAGIAWTMRYDPDRGSQGKNDSPTPRAEWHSANVRTAQRSLMVMSEQRYRLASGVAGQLVAGLVTGVVRAVFGAPDRDDDPAAFYASAVQLPPGPLGADFPFAVAVSPEMPRDWPDAELRRLLTEWPAERRRDPDAIDVTLGPHGLKIVVRDMPATMACWQHLARLGEHLAERLVAARR